MFELLQERQDYDFIGNQHRLYHKFHMNIVGEQNNKAFVVCNNVIRDAVSSIHFDSDINFFMRAQFIRSNTCSLPFPAYESIRPAILKSFWQARRSTFDFAFGGLTFFRRNNSQKSNNLLDTPQEVRLLEQVYPEKQTCDAETLQQILNSGEVAVLKLAANMECNFATIKASVEKKPIKNAAAALLYDAIKHADTPTFARIIC